MQRPLHLRARANRLQLPHWRRRREEGGARRLAKSETVGYGHYVRSSTLASRGYRPPRENDGLSCHRWELRQLRETSPRMWTMSRATFARADRNSHCCDSENIANASMRELSMTAAMFAISVKADSRSTDIARGAKSSTQTVPTATSRQIIGAPA